MDGAAVSGILPDFTGADWRVGDLVWIWDAINDNHVIWNPHPQGWHELWHSQRNEGTQTLLMAQVQEGMDRTPVFDMSGGDTDQMHWYAQVWRGLRPEPDGYAQTSRGSGSNIATPDITTTEPGSYVFSMYWHKGNGGSGPATPPSGYTLLIEDYSSIFFFGVAVKRKETPGLESPGNWSVVGMGNAQDILEATIAFTSRTSELSAFTVPYG